VSVSPETRAAIERVWPEILDAVATCELTLEGAALKLAKVGVRSVQRYARETPGARKELDDALLDGAELSVARIPQMVMEMPDARRARVLAEYLWKIAASRDPQRFGQSARMQLDVRTVDLTRIIQDANARLAASRPPALIEHATGELVPEAGAGTLGAILESMLR
jgi:hypothetical protein